jgi:glycosyltransferase involved in cell wall biosynthesis
MTEPRVLVISNTAIKRSNSNGLCLLNVLSTTPVLNIVSFYIQNSYPDKGVVSSSFRLTDSEKLHSYFNGKSEGTIIDDGSIVESKDQDIQHGSGKESFFRHLVREKVWQHGKWNRKAFYDWVATFKPTVILFMNGRSPFMFDITRQVSLKFNIPVVIFSSEDEYWHKPKPGNLWDLILRKKLKKATKRLNKRVAHVITFNDKLKELYESEFHLPVATIMPASDTTPVNAVNGAGNLFYGGNLKPYRYEALAELSEALLEIGSKRSIDVYSNDIDPKIKSRLSSFSNVVIHEAVARKNLEPLREQAALLIHFESDSKKARPLIQHAFSSKIADCLSSGIPFFAYAPSYCGFSPYFEQHSNAVCYVEKKEDLKPALLKALADQEYRSSLVKNALELAAKNHNIQVNSELTKKILMEAHL